MSRGNSSAMLAALDQQMINPPETTATTPATKGRSRDGLKHIGGYLTRDTVLKVAMLRAELDMDNSDLLTHAIEVLHAQVIARKAFGD